MNIIHTYTKPTKYIKKKKGHEKKKNQVQKLLLAKGHQNLSSSCVISGQCRTTISSSSGLSCLLTITVLKERERWDEIAKIVCPSVILF